MALIPADEQLHEPGRSPQWQENCFLFGWDDEQGCGFYVHLERFADTGEAEIKAVIFTPTLVGSVTESHPFGATFDLPGFELAVVDPFRELRLCLEVKGHEGEGDWLAPPGPGALPMSLDLMLRNTLPPLDWHWGFEQFGIPSIGGSHYEVAGAWSGELSLGPRAFSAAGLFIRDHSWGPRDLSDFEAAWWTPMVFDGGTAFISGISFLRHGRWTGITLVDDGGGARGVRNHLVQITGTPVPRGYTGAGILVLPDAGDPIRISATPRAHVPVEYPGFGPGYYMNDALCRCQWGHRRGFGNVELNRRHGLEIRMP
ncbi:MAG: DUF7065 domain-containing protein [Acidimicrobiia bacterium]